MPPRLVNRNGSLASVRDVGTNPFGRLQPAAADIAHGQPLDEFAEPSFPVVKPYIEKQAIALPRYKSNAGPIILARQSRMQDHPFLNGDGEGDDAGIALGPGTSDMERGVKAKGRSQSEGTLLRSKAPPDTVASAPSGCNATRETTF